ncbi:MAG: protein-glutamate O-methyltransferase CheR [Gammaproteobacteria bacterium]|nr:MAG: protein-glutamate O-methyltransferase CheR [Gammaproteobacteria bacterium]
MSLPGTVQAPANARVREFAFADADFEALRVLVKQETGINLTDSKRELVYGRVARRLRALGLQSFIEYRALLERSGAEEMVQFCNAITTNLTAFYRESHHFDFLAEHLKRLDRAGVRRLRIWSAGCSSGEEPYTIAMTILEALPTYPRWDIRILATDLDSDVLERASRGCYSAERVAGIGPRRRAQYLRAVQTRSGPGFEVTPEVRSMVVFKQLNLMHPLPMKGPLDAIFCRNVVIYFDKDTQRALFTRMARLQRTDALLFLGHSESLFKVSEDYELLGKTIYRRS